LRSFFGFEQFGTILSNFEHFLSRIEQLLSNFEQFFFPAPKKFNLIPFKSNFNLNLKKKHS